jgi:phage terminase large subunit GpA-like protein
LVDAAIFHFQANIYKHAGEWAENNLKMVDGGGKGANYVRERCPYFEAIFEAILNSAYKRVVVCMAAQMGKTQFIIANILYKAMINPQSTLVVLPSEALTVDFSRNRLLRSIDEIPLIRSMTQTFTSARSVNLTIAGEPIRVVHATSGSRLCSFPAKYLYLDEIDLIKMDVGGDYGDAVALAEARLASYPNTISFLASTPTNEFGPIWTYLKEGTWGKWSLECLDCKKYFVPCIEIFEATKNEDSNAYTGAMVCPHCKSYIYNDRRDELLKTGKYEYINPNSNIASFWVSGLCSPNTDFNKLAMELLQAKEANNFRKLKTCYNTKFGETYTLISEDIDERILQETGREYKYQDLPIKYIACGVDIQKMRIYYVLRAFCEGGNSYLLEYGFLEGDTENDLVWSKLDILLKKTEYGRAIKPVGIDSRFRPSGVYSFINKHQTTCCALRGVNGHENNPVKGYTMKPAFAGHQYYDHNFFTYAVSDPFFKSQLYAEIKKGENWFINNKASTDEDYIKQVTAEYETIEKNKVIWKKRSEDNHYLDCEKFCLALAYLKGPGALTTNTDKGKTENRKRIVERPFIL